MMIMENTPDTWGRLMREKVKEAIEAFGVKALDFSFSTNFSFKKKPLLKKNPFLAQVLSSERKCVDVYGYDPLLSKEEIEAFGVNALDDMLQITNHILPIADRMDCVIVAVAHNEFKKMKLEDVKKFMNNNPVLVDVKGVFNGEDAKGKGFYYKRL